MDEQEVNVDELLSQIEAPTEQTNATEQAPVEQPTAPTWNGQEWEFEVNGKKVFPETQDKARIWMSQGYNYSQRMGEFNKTLEQKQAEWAQKESQWKALQRWQEMNEYAEKNPQWWSHVEQAWQNREAQQIDPAIEPVLRPIQEKLGQFEQFIGTLQQEREEQNRIKEDQALDSEILSIRKEFPNIDLDSLDPNSGEPLERAILRHAAQIGTRSFKTAFWDYLGPRIVDMARADGREQLAKDKQATAKAGILGRSQVPTKGVTQAQNVRGKSYGDLASEALAELANGTL